MVRKVKNERRSLNSSALNATNSSILDDDDKRASDFDYAEFIKQFERLDVNEDCELIGCKKPINQIRQRIEGFLAKADPPRQNFASLIVGPSGTGKTFVLRKLAAQYEGKLSFFHLDASWMMLKKFGTPETRLDSLFDAAIEKAPALVFIDRMDMLGGQSEKRSSSDSKDRLILTIGHKLEHINSICAQVLVLAATNKPDSLDSELKKRYFNKEIKFHLPSRDDRVGFIDYLAKKYKGSLNQAEIKELADVCHCYSFRDLLKLCNQSLDEHSELNLSNLKLTLGDFKPDATESITSPCPPLKWDDIGGVEHAKRILQESVIWPLLHPDEFKYYGIQSSKGVMLYGPPGCSKTMLAQALASESGYSFIYVKGPELNSKYVGDSEAALRRLYRNAREIAPCLIFFDEFDGFVPERSDHQSSSVGEKVVTTFLAELNGSLQNVFTIAATNRPDRVDRALIRKGRLNPAIYIPLPSESDRKSIFRVHMRALPLKTTTDNPDYTWAHVTDWLAKETDGYSGAEVADVCRTAAMAALRESLAQDRRSPIERRHFEEALREVEPETHLAQLEIYEKFKLKV